LLRKNFGTAHIPEIAGFLTRVMMAEVYCFIWKIRDADL
jgi:hypothetical protein